jgi:uncharacterized protein
MFCAGAIYVSQLNTAAKSTFPIWPTYALGAGATGALYLVFAAMWGWWPTTRSLTERPTGSAQLPAADNDARAAGVTALAASSATADALGRASNASAGEFSLPPPVTSWPCVADADPLLFGVHRARSLGDLDSLMPPYVSRDIDARLRSRLSAAGERGGLVLLVGDSTAGKTRAAFEAMRSVMTNNRVLTPPHNSDLSALPGLIDRERLSAVLWLDDLERFLRPRGLTAELFSELVKRRVAIVATMRAEQYQAYSGRVQSAAAVADVLNLVEPIEISRLWSGPELDRVAHQQDERLLEAAAHHGAYGIAEYLAAGPPLLLEWRQASRVRGHPRGAALVRAAVDLARVGLRGPIPENLLARIHEQYLAEAGGARLRPETFAAALSWATEVHYGAASMLIPGDVNGTWQAFDYLIDAVNRDVGNNRILNATWEAVRVRQLSASDQFAVGVEALAKGKKKIAEKAWRPLAESGDVWAMYNLGCLYAETEEIAPLVQWWGGGSAIFMANAKRADEAEMWWRRAAKMGHVESMHNLGILLIGKEDKQSQDEGFLWWERADERRADRVLPNVFEDPD